MCPSERSPDNATASTDADDDALVAAVVDNDGGHSGDDDHDDVYQMLGSHFKFVSLFFFNKT